MSIAHISANGVETIRIARSAKADTRPSPRRMGWMLTAGAAALALALGAALPARAADRDDIAKALVAALVVGAIIHEVNDRDDRKKPSSAPAPESIYKKKRREHVPVVPSVCAMEFEGERRSVTVYPERCLRREGISERLLPRHCAKDARIWGKRDRIYSERCLRDAGFKLARPRYHD